jgi:hypothetical protein
MTSSLSLLLFLNASAVAGGTTDWLSPTLARVALAQAPEGTSRVEVGRHREHIPNGCTITDAELFGRLLGTGQSIFKLKGTDGAGRTCFGWSWASIRVFSQAWVTTREIAPGAPVAGLVASAERELPQGGTYARSIAPDALASSRLSAGTALEPKHLRLPSEMPGHAVDVELRTGDLVIATRGESVPCQPNMSCARLASGKQVSGTWLNGRLEVVLP